MAKEKHLVPPLIRGALKQLVLGRSGAMNGTPDRPEHVLSFWFGRPPRERFEIEDMLWLPTRIPCWGGHWARRLLDVDAVITRHFGTLHLQATEGDLDHWCDTAQGRLALIILLDQLSRNIHRGTPQAFAQDAKTLPLVLEGLKQGQDQLFNPLARSLFYMPLMHHEDLEHLDHCVGLYEAALEDASKVPSVVLKVELTSAKRHREIVVRFGRYPHRNVILGRESTAEELDFLKERFSSF